jgi:chromatin segregation and condensation protein Rec8/ScpA/Scc1 (kleisin family)
MSTDRLPTQQDDFPGWYVEVVKRAEMAEHGPAKGSMIIKPHGYAIWERMQADVDRRIKEAAAWLVDRLDEESDRYFRLGPAPLAPRIERQLAPQDPAELATILRALTAEPPAVSLAHLELRFPPVEQFLGRFRSLLARRTRFDFDTEVHHLTRVEQAVAFLALLELRKAGEIELSQAAAFAPIRVQRNAETKTERNPAWTARSA